MRQTHATSRQPGVFDLLTQLASDDRMSEIFSARSMVETWLRSEVALATAQSSLGLISSADREAIALAARTDDIDLDRLWEESRNVGYPILPLVRQVDELLPKKNRGSLHRGATTQDIMDTGLALQLVEATTYLRELLEQTGDLVAQQSQKHVATVMPGRTHAMHAVPTTWGAKLAVYLTDFTRHASRLADAQDQVAAVSLYGAGGTSAAYGPQADTIRAHVAAQVGLRCDRVPWHVSRGRLVEWGQACVALTATTSRLGREIIDLSRTEIAEVTERSGHHRGASSTMPQKSNPITSEVLVGLATVANALSASLGPIMEAGHERAAGQWQAEWFVIPQLAGLTAAALTAAVDLATGLEVHAEAMRGNLEVDRGLIMAEAHMIAVADTLGRERAHDVVYEAARRARSRSIGLRDALSEVLGSEHVNGVRELDASGYVGDPGTVVASALQGWRDLKRIGAQV